MSSKSTTSPKETSSKSTKAKDDTVNVEDDEKDIITEEVSTKEDKQDSKEDKSVTSNQPDIKEEKEEDIRVLQDESVTTDANALNTTTIAAANATTTTTTTTTVDNANATFNTTASTPIIVNEQQQEQEQPSNTRSRSSSINPSAILETTLDGLATISSKINPFTQRIGKGLGQVRQYAQEKFGTAEDITELPEEYKELEKRVDALQQIHQNFLKVTKTYNSTAYDYPVQLQESLKGFTNTVTSQIQQLTNKSHDRAQTSSVIAAAADEHPKTLSHAIGRVALEGATEIGQDDAFGAALQRLGEASTRLGNARLTMDHEIVSKFNTPLQVTLKTTIEGVNKARRQVQLKRLALDAAKTDYRESPANKLDAARLEVEQAEDQFVGAVEEATHLMKSLLEDPEPFRDLADFAQVQLSYFKEAQELFSSLVPELEEIRITQESLYRETDQA
ncbi:MAG: Bin/amphiphysin/Rvs domain for vesicular trafficking-domain-containing protein [Benjaminiella poitrasii]|nr:MAG: Bin/amphiphysin/Rvs domain for vesicular trafficking-domain-containing protein [Benjaminiella poitrasii]